MYESIIKIGSFFMSKRSIDTMKNYISVKQIKAQPMNLGQYYKYKGYSVPDADRIDAKGYIIYYPDGYISWTPEAVFKKSYLEMMEENSITQRDVDNFIAKTEAIKLGDKTTVAQTILKNGFILTESSSCVDVNNFDMEIGKDCCMEQIKHNIWFLLGFLLQSAKYGFNRGEK